MPKIAAVSLLVDYHKNPLSIYRECEDHFDATPVFIENNGKFRVEQLKDNILWARENKVDLLIFPGWSIVQPKDLKEIASYVNKDLHVILELYDGASEFRNVINDKRKYFLSENFLDDSGVFILSGKKVKFGPIFQTISEGKDLNYQYNVGMIRQLKSEFSNEVIWDRRDTDSYLGTGQGRWLDLGNKGRYLIILCGEANLVNDKNGDWLGKSKEYGFHNIEYKKATAIINPAHVAPTNYMNTKRKVWSKITDTPLIHCANINNQLRESRGELKIKKNYDGTQVFISGDSFNLIDPFKESIQEKNVFFKGKKISISNTEEYQRAIINL